MAAYDIRVWEVWKAATFTGSPYAAWNWTVRVSGDIEPVAEGTGVPKESYAKIAAENAAKLHWHQQQLNSYSYEFDPSVV